MHDKCQISLGLGSQHTSRRKTRVVDEQRVVITCPLDGIWGIGNNQLKGFIIPMLRGGQCIFTGNIKLIKTNIMQEHIDAAQVVGGNIYFLSIKTIADSIFAKNFFRLQEQ